LFGSLAAVHFLFLHDSGQHLLRCCCKHPVSALHTGGIESCTTEAPNQTKPNQTKHTSYLQILSTKQHHKQGHTHKPLPQQQQAAIMSAAAASTAHRQQLVAENRKRQMAVQFQRKARRQTALLVFSQLASEQDDTKLPVSQVSEFLSQVMKVRRESLQPDAVQLVIDSAQKVQKAGQQQQQQHESGDDMLLEKEALLASFEKYGEYVSNSETIDHIFSKFDKNQDGYLSRRDLRLALEDYEAHHAGRYVHGVAIRLILTDHDLDFILQQSDVGHDGKIDHAELLPALAAWEEIASIKLDEKEKNMCCCTLL
jgi:EF-hand domain